jgi:acyl carrier protein
MRRLERVFEDALSMAAPPSDTDIVEAGLIDSLAMVTLLFEIEQEFGLTMPLDWLEIEDLRSTERIAQLISRLREEPAA